MSDVVLIEHEGPLSVVTVNRPSVLNALNADVLRALIQVFGDLGMRPECRAVLLKGQGEKAFVAGADIAAMQAMTFSQTEEFIALGQTAMNTIEAFPWPTAACVQGFALGGGLELALACDFIWADETAQLGLPEVGVGLFPGFGGTQRLARRIGCARAKEVIFSACRLKAPEALSWGLVNRVTPAGTLMESAKAWLAEMTTKAPIAIRLAKKLVDQGSEIDLVKALKWEATSFVSIINSNDRIEGLNAFLEKRKPVFQNK
jgi:enoyl-CoA hydratase